MNKSLFAVAFAVFVAASTLSLSAGAQIYDPGATAADQGAANTYNTIRNQQMQREARMRAQRKGGQPETGKQRGTRIIDAGRASLKFAARPFPINATMKGAWNGSPATRKKNYAEYLAQSALWKAELRERGAKTNDVADVYSVALVMSFEAMSGRHVNAQGFGAVRDDLRAFFLKQAAAFQGSNSAEKQEFAESAFLIASNALRLRRAGQIKDAEKEGRAFVDSWAPGKSAGALETLTPLSSPRKTGA